MKKVTKNAIDRIEQNNAKIVAHHTATRFEGIGDRSYEEIVDSCMAISGYEKTWEQKSSLLEYGPVIEDIARRNTEISASRFALNALQLGGDYKKSYGESMNFSGYQKVWKKRGLLE